MSDESDAGMRYRRAVGRTIATLRSQQGISLRGMSEASGVSVAYLSELEHGQKEPSATMLGQLADAFRVTLPEFLHAIAEDLDSEEITHEISVEGLDRDDLDEVARFADWLRWRKEQH